MSVADINTRVAAAVTAMDAGDWTTAETKLLGAQALMAALPNGGHGEETLNWNPNGLRDLLMQVRMKRGAGLKIQRTKIQRVAVDDDGCPCS